MRQLIATLTLIVICGLTTNAAAQVESYYVLSNELNLRELPNAKAAILEKIVKDEEILVLDKSLDEWWLIEYEGTRGYVASRFLTNVDPFVDWDKISLKTGDDAPECSNIIPKYDLEMDNYLTVRVMSYKRDAIVKLMDYYSDICIRAIYIKAGESVTLKNIPEGKYYVYDAIGNDFRKNKLYGSCKMRFVRNAIYEKLDKILDYHLVETEDGAKIPSFELRLAIETDNPIQHNRNNVDGSEISEEMFNK